MPTTLPIDLLASSDLGSSNTDNLTNDDTPTLAGFAGVALFGATVELSSGLDGVLGSTTVGADGIWQMTLPQISQSYNHWITATITAPDTSITTETIRLAIDTYAVINIDQPVANNGVIDGAFTLSGTVSGVNNSSVVSIVLTDNDDNTVELTAPLSANAWSVNVSEENLNELGVASIAVDVNVTDSAGNVAQDTTNLERTGINLSASSDTGMSSIDDLTNDSTPLIKGYTNSSFAGGAVVLSSSLDGVVANTTVDANGYWQVTSSELTYGSHQIIATITAVDSTVITNTLALSIDASVSISINPPVTSVDGLVLAGTASGVENGREVTLTLTDSGSNTETVNAVVIDSQWQVTTNTIPSNNLVAGDITFDAQVSDKAGNVATDSIVANIPFESLATNILDSLLLANGETVILLDSPTGFVLQHVDSLFNPLNTSVHLTAADELGDMVLDVVNTTTSNYALYSDDKVWAFNDSGVLLAESAAVIPQQGVATTGEPAFFHGTDDGFVLVKEQRHQLSVLGEDESRTYSYETTVDFLFFDTNAVLLDTKQESYSFGVSSIWLPPNPLSPAGGYLYSAHGNDISGIESSNLPNGDILVVVQSRPYSDILYERGGDALYKAFVFDINGNTVDQIASFDINSVQPFDEFSLNADDTNFTLTTASDAVTIRYDSFYPEGYLNLPTVNEIDTSNTKPWLSGTFDSEDSAMFTVTVDGQTYTLGEDSNLFQHANNDNTWVLSPVVSYSLGTHDVVATSTDIVGRVRSDNSSDELTITQAASITIENPVTEAIAGNAPLHVSGFVDGVEEGQAVTVTFTDSNGDFYEYTTPVVWGYPIFGTDIDLFGLHLTETELDQLLLLEQGPLTVTASVTNLAGNTAQDTLLVPEGFDVLASVDIDETAALSDGVIDQNEIGDLILSGTTESVNDGQMVSVEIVDESGNTVNFSAQVNNDSWNVAATDYLTGMQQGTLQINANVFDVFGYEGNDSVSVELNLGFGTPTVNNVTTSNTHTWLSGTFDSVGTNELTVTVDGKTYSLGEDSNLFQHAHHANTWILKPQGFYHLGEHDVVVTATGSNGVSAVDRTTGELTISRDMNAPRVNPAKQIYNKRPAVGGSFDEAATEELTVELDGTVYTLGVDAELSNHLNNKWVLNLSTLETPLSDGVYDVIVNTTDANSVTLQDASTGELTIGMLAPTVYELESTNFKPVLRGFYDADFGDGLTVTVNGDSYTLGVDGELTTHASNDNLWVLRPSNVLNFGNNDIQVTAIDTRGKDKTDITSDEIHIYQTKSQAADGDVLITQAGDDTITINDNTFNQINAGLGVDTLVLDGDAINLNFAKIQGIDVVDMSGSASTANTLTLTLDDVLTKTDNSSLSVLGDSADTVTLATADNWNTNGSQVIDGVTYDGYDSGAASLLIEQGVVVQVV